MATFGLFERLPNDVWGNIWRQVYTDSIVKQDWFKVVEKFKMDKINKVVDELKEHQGDMGIIKVGDILHVDNYDDDAGWCWNLYKVVEEIDKYYIVKELIVLKLIETIDYTEESCILRLGFYAPIVDDIDEVEVTLEKVDDDEEPTLWNNGYEKWNPKRMVKYLTAY
jgi:hypothetical protein